MGWYGFGLGAETWGILAIVIALLITTLVALTRRDVAYGLVIIVALIGIPVNQSGNRSATLVAQISAVIVSVVVVADVLPEILKSKHES